jgi:DinB superfamily
LSEARARTLDLIADLSDEQMIGPRLAIVNPLRWEIAHVALSTRLKMAVLAPMPSASESTAKAVKPGVLSNFRAP